MSEDKKNNKNLAKVIIAIIIVVIAAAVCFFVLYRSHVNKMYEAVNIDTFYNGVMVNGVELGGYTMEEAKEKLNSDINEKIKDEIIELKDGSGNAFQLKYSDFDGKYNIDDTLLAAYNYARNGDIKERYKLIKDLENNPKDFEAEFTYNAALLKEKLNEIASAINVEAQDSTISRENGQFVITDERQGYEMEIDATYEKIKPVIESMDEETIDIVGKVTEPNVTREENEKATTLIGTYYTTFSGGSANAGRNENLRVGCEHVNGTVLKPGETFSMNEALGPQTYENGYRNAAVIVNGKIEDGLAGGVCQITSTLYNAVILAELKVVERSNHSLAVAYVPLGQDAAVAGDYKDLKFQNDTDYPIYIETYLSGNKLIANVYGYEIHDSGREVEFENIVDSIIPKPAEKITEDPELPKDYREVTYYGKEGKKVSTYKIVYENGVQISREFFSKSTYSATADEVTIGTKEEETAENGSEVSDNTGASSENNEAENSLGGDGTLFGQ